ncbi:hypothetical protein [Accumulibacter sp.]|uniref:hypothetical protein n=1 Tax=Accumulibacter sp. TaxID=2053492 RepID=UPI0025DEFC84|nr:hypothetical protein [Accumulibacter sp.]MCM8595357.1 hypothetical protein [Accumulibacter sp.]MCM8625300.1 hypothetical protein [Accumulibacter sp.]MDS4049504.1 hypothetical protein [Accumulibacter sp.]
MPTQDTTSTAPSPMHAAPLASAPVRYLDSELNGWDYVMAITEEQVNNGLRIAFQGSYRGPRLPEIPKQIRVTYAGDIEITLELGPPTIHARRSGLNLCDLEVPILHGAIRPGSSPHATRMHTLEKGATLRITTSLASDEVRVEDTGPGSSGGYVEHDIYVRFKDRKAIYSVVLTQPWESKVPLDTLQDLIQQELWRWNGREFRIGGFRVAADADPFVPRLVDFSFVLDERNPARNTLLVCASLDDNGPSTDDRLRFAAPILPEGLPAALWLGDRLVMGRILQPMMAEAFARIGVSRVAYDGRTKTLSIPAPVALAPVKGHTTTLAEFTLRPSGRRFVVHSLTNSLDWTFVGLNFAAKVDGHIAVGVSADHCSFVSSSGVDEKSHEITNLTFWKLLGLAYASAATLAIFAFIFGSVLDDIFKALDSGTDSAMSSHLTTASGKLNEIAARVPALEDLGASGHLVFDDLVLHDSGAVCVGIRRTQAA